jgi:hypothetical protein
MIIEKKAINQILRIQLKIKKANGCNKDRIIRLREGEYV